MARLYDVAFMRSFWAALLLPAIDGALEEVGSRVLAGGVDVVVLGVFTHLEIGSSSLRELVSKE